MGSDNLHHRRKHKTLNSLERKRLRRESYDVVLIVCEGKKTEPYYLRGLCDESKLNSANIRVLGRGADPQTIVKDAIEEFNKFKDYNKVYCVFDQDEHKNYQFVLGIIAQHRRNGIPIYSITSVPCFEYWILLHFVDRSRAYKKAGKKSAGDQLFSEVKQHIPDYKKGHKQIYEITKARLPTAISRAKKIEKENLKIGTDNPSTTFYQLVEYLQQLKK